MSGYYNRYSKFEIDEEQQYVPFIKLTPKDSDKFINYVLGKTRLDKVSSQEYGAPFYSFLILMGNPEFGGLEQNIPNNTLIRIPYPLRATLNEYKEKVDRYRRLYGE